MKGLFFKPGRVCLNITGGPIVKNITRLMTIMNGEKSNKNIIAKNMSMILFIIL